MTVVKGSFRWSALLLGALLFAACDASDEAGGTTDDEREPARGQSKDASTKSEKDAASAAKDAGANGGRADAGGAARDAGRDARAANSDEDEPKQGDDEDDDADDDGPDEPADDPGGDDEPSDEPDGEEKPKDGGASEGPRGEVITTESGDKIYVDPSCPNLMPMLAGRAIELVGCCMADTMKCGLSTHKLMIPAQFASMFPTKCRGYDELAMLMIEAPAEQACSVPSE